jgi:tripartite-type tricarboxylate transporter receptor subunit TctC
VAREVQMVFANMSDAVGQIEAGTLRPLAVTTAKRAPSAPNVPTMIEAGVPGYAAESWNAFFAPKGTPQPVIDRIAEVAAAMAKDETVQKRLFAIGSVAVANTPAEFARQLREETAQWANLVKEIGSKR